MSQEETLIYVEGEAQHELILREAEKRGIELRDVSSEYNKRATLLVLGAHEELLIQGIPSSWLNEKASRICDEKQLTKKLFKRTEIPTPKSYIFTDPSDLGTLALFDGVKEYVCKPTVGTNGIGVALDISSMEDVRTYFARNKELGSAFLLEELYHGYDLRIQVIGGTIVAACIRIPAQVYGDGIRTLQELIDARRKVIKIQNPANGLEIDAQSMQLIELQGFKLGSIVPAGTNVSLKKISNMAQGGHAIDVTAEISPVFAFWVDKLVNELKTGYFALDLMCKQHEAYHDGAATAIEINARAEWLHHTFSEIRTHDLAKIVLDVLFSE